jgi:hypothetical protein
VTTYLLFIGIALSQLLNAVTGGLPDETLSARAYRADRDGRLWGVILRPIIDAVFMDSWHCFNAHEAEMRQLQLPLEYRK